MERYRSKYDIVFGIEHRMVTGGYGGEVEQRGEARMEVSK